MRTIVFYGDSNTYGYDPRGFMGGRYPEDGIWTAIVQEKLGDSWRVENQGLNGRTIPFGHVGFAYAEGILKKIKKNDIFAVMLGTNDILLSDRPDAGAAIVKMDLFLEWLLKWHPAANTLLIAPVPVGSEDSSDPLYKRFREECLSMNAGFALLSRQHGVHFADAGKWGIDLAYDQDHLSETGHRQFAEHILKVLEDIK